MNIVIVGLGIIGGSYAKAIKKYTPHTVVGINRSRAALDQALHIGAIDKIGTREDLKQADMVILCVYPQAAVKFVAENGENIKPNAIVVDTAGIKREICPALVKLAKEHGFIFVGGHPMAGKEQNGFSFSDADLFINASFILVPCSAPDHAVETVSTFMLSLGFGSIRLSTPQEHDQMIAFTSQLPHALACGYVLSPSCPNHKGFSAGSYKDVSRVANINASLWAELFLENKENLTYELNTLIDNLTKIKLAVENENKEGLTSLLKQGKAVKEALGE